MVVENQDFYDILRPAKHSVSAWRKESKAVF
jgi:hypothetical protein